jgi:hypothetical protein
MPVDAPKSVNGKCSLSSCKSLFVIILEIIIQKIP